MASSMIHIAIASELNKKLNRDEYQLFIGTIAPDISKIIGQPKEISHFSIEDENYPNLSLFLDKYKQHLNDDFVLGYYIHLYVDYLWFKYFIPEIDNKKMITTLDGKVVDYDHDLLWEYIYNDYTDLNIKVIDYYNLNLKIFYNDLPAIKPIIKEIPMEKLYIIVNKAGEFIKKSKIGKDYVINMDEIKQFINMSLAIIYSNLIDLGVIHEEDI